MKNIKLLEIKEYNNIVHLFSENFPNIAFIKAILEGKMPGNVWIDISNNKPISALITSGMYCFISGNLTDHSKDKYLSILNNQRTFKLVCNVQDSNLFNQEIEKFNFETIDRLQFFYKNHPKRNQDIIINKDYQIATINEEILKKCLFNEVIINFYETPDNFIKNAKGVCLLHNNIVITEAYAILGGKHAELGTCTHPDYRKQGLSSYLCSFLQKQLHKEHYITSWTCDKDNIGSQKAAKNIGMEYVGNYKFICKTNSSE